VSKSDSEQTVELDEEVDCRLSVAGCCCCGVHRDLQLVLSATSRHVDELVARLPTTDKHLSLRLRDAS